MTSVLWDHCANRCAAVTPHLCLRICLQEVTICDFKGWRGSQLSGSILCPLLSEEQRPVTAAELPLSLKSHIDSNLSIRNSKCSLDSGRSSAGLFIHKVDKSGDIFINPALRKGVIRVCFNSHGASHERDRRPSCLLECLLLSRYQSMSTAAESTQGSQRAASASQREKWLECLRVSGSEYQTHCP